MSIINLASTNTYSVYYAVVDASGYQTSNKLGRFGVKAKDESELHIFLRGRIADMEEELHQTLKIVKIEVVKRA